MRTMTHWSLAVLAFLVIGIAAQSPEAKAQSAKPEELRAGSFNTGWIVKPATGAFAVLVSTAKPPQTVTLPHDAMLGLQRAPEHGSSSGYFPGGAFEYQKTFRVPADLRGKRVTFEFEGVYRDAMVFINGEFAAQRPHGYSTFYVPANAFLKYGEANTIRVVARAFYVAAVVKPLLAYFFPCLLWVQCPLVQSRLTALVDTQLRLTHVLPPMQVQTRSTPIDLFPQLR